MFFTTEAQKKEMAKLREKGFKAKDIAETYGVSVSTVYYACQDYGSKNKVIEVTEEPPAPEICQGEPNHNPLLLDYLAFLGICTVEDFVRFTINGHKK